MTSRQIDIHDRRNLTDLIRRAAYTLTGNAQSIRESF